MAADGAFAVPTDVIRELGAGGRDACFGAALRAFHEKNGKLMGRV